MNDAAISDEQHLDRIADVLRNAYSRACYKFEPTDFRTPLIELLTKEEGAEADEAKEVGEFEQEIRLKTFKNMLLYIFADGPHPGASMRRLYALARGFSPELIANMNGTDLAQMFNESQASQSWRALKMFDGYLKERGAHSGKVSFQKSDSARAVYSKVQKGNTNRRGKSGRKTIFK